MSVRIGASTIAATAALYIGLAPGSAEAASPDFIILPPSCSFVWTPLGTGCARTISVGANNVPWILGCPDGNANATGPAWVYYLSYSNSGGNLISTPKWNYDNFGQAIDVFVNLNGTPWVSAANGQFYLDNLAPAAGSVDTQPNGQWAEVSVPNVGYMGPAVVSANYTNSSVNAGVLWYPQQPTDYANPYLINQVWGIGCGNVCNRGPFLPLSGNPNGNIFTTEFQVLDDYGQSSFYDTPWQHLPGAAIAIALFTDPPTSATLGNGSNTVQNPWVLNEQGQIWIWNPSAYNWVQAPLFPTGSQVARSITDHYAIDSGNNVWQWNGTSAGAGSWVEMRGLDPVYTGSSGPSIKQLAFSQAATGHLVGQSANIGPSELWAVDYSGNVYTADFTCVAQ